MLRSMLCLALLVLLCAGCKKAPLIEARKVPLELPPAWTRVENPEQGLTIGAPQGWAVGAYDSMDMAMVDLANYGGDTSSPNVAAMQENMNREAEAQAAADVKALEKKDIYLSVVDKSSRPIIGEERTRFIVHRKRTGGNAGFEEGVDAAREEMINEEAPKEVELPIGKAKVLRSVTTLRDGGVVSKVYYILVNRGDIYTVKFITQNQGMKLDDLAQEVMQTFRIDK